MKARLTILLVIIALVATPLLVSAVNRPSEALGGTESNGIQNSAILVGPNNQSINLLVFDTGLAANTNHIVHVSRNDTCGAAGFSLTGPIGPFATNNVGFLNIAVTQALVAPIDQAGTQDIAVRILDNNGVTVRCANVFTNRPMGAGRHWW